jgi:hypothetical protein
MLQNRQQSQQHRATNPTLMKEYPQTNTIVIARLTETIARESSLYATKQLMDEPDWLQSAPIQSHTKKAARIQVYPITIGSERKKMFHLTILLKK